MKVLLSPAKALDFSKEINTSEYTTPIFISEAESLVKKLKKFSDKKIAKMMHLSPELGSLNFERYQNWQPTVERNNNNGHAIAVFNGEVYRGFDALSLTKEQIETAQNTVRILSGIYGILKPLDIIYPYRLEMGTKWAVTPAKKNLYQFWGKKIAEAINEEMEGEEIINLASAEYFKAVDKKTLKADVITPVFKDFKNGEYKVIMVFAKQARGAMARYIVDNKISNSEELKGYNVDGYRYDENLSTEKEWVFTR